MVLLARRSICRYTKWYEIEEESESNGKPYSLSASMGYAISNLSVETIDDFMNRIDRQMYLDKEVHLEVYHGGDYLSCTEAVSKDYNTKKKPFPIGVSDFKMATTEYYYVDKTLLIRDFLDTKPMVSLFTRPRRFGKTLNMDMLRVFFEKTPEDTSIYFQDKRIWQCGDFYTQHQGQYPVIFLTGILRVAKENIFSGMNNLKINSILDTNLISGL